jgi:hypothetical protein
MKVDVPYGEVADRISILLLKEARIAGNSRHRLLLEAAWAAEGLPDLRELPEWADLCSVNAGLWDAEEALRAAEREGRFDDAFVEAARSVYRLNDRRAALKRAIDVGLGSPLVEEKSYGR